MILRIQARTDDGKYVDRSACVGDFARQAIRQIIEDGSHGTGDGWQWLRQWIGLVCISMAEKNSGNPTVADRWYARYQGVRGIE